MKDAVLLLCIRFTREREVVQLRPTLVKWQNQLK